MLHETAGVRPGPQHRHFGALPVLRLGLGRSVGPTSPLSYDPLLKAAPVAHGSNYRGLVCCAACFEAKIWHSPASKDLSRIVKETLRYCVLLTSCGYNWHSLAFDLRKTQTGLPDLSVYGASTWTSEIEALIGSKVTMVDKDRRT